MISLKTNKSNNNFEITFHLRFSYYDFEGVSKKYGQKIILGL